MNAIDSAINVGYKLFQWLLHFFPEKETNALDFYEHSALGKMLQTANYFVPIPTAIVCVGIVLSVAGGILIYKLVKVFRGGG